MKKIIALLLAMIMVLALAACAAKTEPAQAETTAETTAPAETTETTETAAPRISLYLNIGTNEDFRSRKSTAIPQSGISHRDSDISFPLMPLHTK